LTFDTNASVAKLFFTPTGFISEDMAAQVQTILADQELINEYKSVDLNTLGDEPGTPLAVVNTGPAPSNIQPQAAPAKPAPQPVQQAVPQPVTPAAPKVQKFGVSAADTPVEVPVPAQQATPSPTAAPASTADIDQLLAGIEF
jgi:hypothetical protein